MQRLSRDAEIAWAAGLFEGEGSVHKGGTLALGMTDEDVVRHFQAIVTRGTIGPTRTRVATHKTMWLWRTSYRDDILFVAEMLYPLLGARRRAQLDAALPVVRARKQLRRRELVVCPACGYETNAQGLKLHERACLAR